MASSGKHPKRFDRGAVGSGYCWQSAAARRPIINTSGYRLA